MTWRRERCGFTLLEVLVAAALALLLLGMVYTLLIPAMRAQSRGSARVDLEQMAVVALDRIAGDLKASAPAGLSVAASPSTLALDRIAGLTDTGVQQWEMDLVIYRLQDGRLIRKVYPASDEASGLVFAGTAPLQVTPTVLAGLALDANGTEETLATDVTQFSVQTGGMPGAPANPVTVTIGLSRSVGDWDAKTQTDQPIQVEMTRTMGMRQQS